MLRSQPWKTDVDPPSSRKLFELGFTMMLVSLALLDYRHQFRPYLPQQRLRVSKTYGKKRLLFQYFREIDLMLQG
ncbi:hypothetical protein A7U60_g7502 [Sanghuangporus baumii]|uniref:Uncharacterized protein n=1 Tax=Sanghuangporus baumii TaxID=108892 RepID=A0A9Q5HTD1_SANBA|nr:hypothetical protein A7U60_g7502 [Sanghuangporus baumii]